MQSIRPYQELINQHLQELSFPPEPEALYDPIRYFLHIGGKRIRPVLTLMGNQLFGGEPSRALPAALAMEVFHNFTLLHDDLMDAAPLRRNRKTVHAMWNANIAILSGDAMLIQAYTLLNQSPREQSPELISIFNQMAMDVCRGQQYDMEFEKESSVSLSEYLTMIRLKTAVLLGTSLRIGALLGGANHNDAERLYHFGESMGMAFQLQDDYLDAFGNPENFGKQIGGDILANKKTFLWVQALQSEDTTSTDRLKYWLQKKDADPGEKIAQVLAIYRNLHIDQKVLQAVQTYSEKAQVALNAIEIENRVKQPLWDLCQGLIHRIA